MDLERQLLEGDLTRLLQDVDYAFEDFTFESLARIRRGIVDFERRWKEHGTPNASPKARKRTPEVKKESHRKKKNS
jgi:hypothetical protein